MIAAKWGQIGFEIMFRPEKKNCDCGSSPWKGSYDRERLCEMSADADGSLNPDVAVGPRLADWGRVPNDGLYSVDY